MVDAREEGIALGLDALDLGFRCRRVRKIKKALQTRKRALLESPLQAAPSLPLERIKKWERRLWLPLQGVHM